MLSTTGGILVKPGRRNSPGGPEVTGTMLVRRAPIPREALHEDCSSYRDRSDTGRLRDRHDPAAIRRADVRGRGAELEHQGQHRDAVPGLAEPRHGEGDA